MIESDAENDPLFFGNLEAAEASNPPPGGSRPERPRIPQGGGFEACEASKSPAGLGARRPVRPRNPPRLRCTDRGRASVQPC